MSDTVSDECEPLNRKEDFTTFGPQSPPSVLTAQFPELFERAADDETAIAYFPRSREFGIPVLDGGGSVIVIAFCPWTGKSLPSSLRERLCDALESLGFDLFSENAPDEFKSERWWIELGL